VVAAGGEETSKSRDEKSQRSLFPQGIVHFPGRCLKL
jgi:hypothetical protein